jgi:serine/threonine-protein kinase
VSLTPGALLGPYEIAALIGEGGMGKVWRAHHTALKRDDALKVLPDAFASDPERLARFRREAQILASLNHPNIAHVYGLEQSDGVQALVMELVEGPTLADRIAQGPIPVDDALPIARQIADALEAAHEQGIIHRDLKPANVKVRDDDTVKVLDFGLAKVAEPTATASSTHSLSPTITTPAMTQAGIILGTAAYMSPEQAKGRAADKRSDVWAFGCVLYEMLTGRRAFDGEDTVDTLGAVARLEPDWTLLPATTPPIIRTLLRRCLEKDRAKRIANMSTLLFVMRESPALTDTAAPASHARPLWKRALPVGIAAVLAAAAAGMVAWTLKPAPSLQVARSRFVLPDAPPNRQQFSTAAFPMVAISPNGTQVAYVANTRLFVRPLAELDGRPITEPSSFTYPPNAPVFSPDGRSVAYWEGGALRKIAVSGGSPFTLTKTDIVFGVDWSEDAVVYGQGAGGIMRVSASGGTPEQLVRVEKNEMALYPQMLPGRRAVLFTLGTGLGGLEQWDMARIVVQDIESGARTVLVDGGSHGRYVPSGHIVYAVGGLLLAAPFDLESMRVTDGAVPVVDGVRRSVGLNTGTGAAHYSFSDTGTLVFVPGPASLSLGTQEITRFDRKGTTEKLRQPPRGYGSIRISPDGRRLAYDIDDGKEANVWVYDLTQNAAPRRLTFGGSNRFPIWSADGKSIVFQSDRDGDRGIFWQRTDGTGRAERLTTPEKDVAHIPESWSPRDERFSYSVVRGSEVSLWTFSMKDKTAARFGDARSAAPFNSEFSADGRWVAYTLRGQGVNVYVEPFPATGAQHQITTENGHHPVWLADGGGLSYRVSAGQQTVVTIATTPGFSVGNAKPALQGDLPITAGTGPRTYDMTGDGSAFLAVTPATYSQTGIEAQEIHIVVNWFEELKRLVPTN